ncbi:MAG: hypothetical protein HQL66_12485 [Magnetococcales bacterium]|nr:hypothetical protein [Magnetococcales bacterium]
MEQLPSVRGNALQLEQVFINVILNGLQALPDPEGSVLVRGWAEADNGLVVFSVEDQGEGIPPENLERILDPFFTTRLNTGGTGLGLSISHKILQDHGGSISFESIVGKGTKVTIRLPLHVQN